MGGGSVYNSCNFHMKQIRSAASRKSYFAFNVFIGSHLAMAIDCLGGTQLLDSWISSLPSHSRTKQPCSTW